MLSWLTFRLGISALLQSQIPCIVFKELVTTENVSKAFSKGLIKYRVDKRIYCTVEYLQQNDKRNQPYWCFHHELLSKWMQPRKNKLWRPTYKKDDYHCDHHKCDSSRRVICYLLLPGVELSRDLPFPETIADQGIKN